MKKLTKFTSFLLAAMLVFSCFTGLTVVTAGAEETEDVYSVFGSSAEVFGGVWFAANPTTEMTLDESDGLYKITFPEVEPTKLLQLKVLKNHDENFSWGAPGTDQNYTVNVDQTCDVTVTFDPVKEVVNVIGEYVTVPQGLQIDNVVAVGNGEETYLNGANWDPCDPGNMLTEVQPGVWQVTFEDIYAFDNYQIKFAANSLDADENPSPNPWAVNWGTELEQIYPTGEWIPAVYNGKNCIFEVEDDESVVRFTLDLRNFNFTTKEGARIKISINPDDDEPIDDPEQPTTEKPTEAATTVKPTDAQPTQPVGSSLTVNAKSNLFGSSTRSYTQNPDTVTVVYYADVTELRLEDIQCEVTYDKSVLSIDPAKNGDYDEDIEEYDLSAMVPVSNGQASVNNDVAGVVKLSVSNQAGMRLNKNGEVIPVVKIVFDVANGAKGSTDVNLTAKSLTFVNPKTSESYRPYTIAYGFNQADYNAVMAKGEVGSYVDEPSDEVPSTVPSTTTPAPTVAPTTVKPTPGAPFTVNAKSNVFNSASKTYDNAPESVTVTYYADITTGLRLQNLQFSVNYDPAVLSIDLAKNGVYDEDDEEYDLSQMLPIAGTNGDANITRPGLVKFAVSVEAGMRLVKNNELVPVAKIVFDVAPGSTGSTDVRMEFGAITFLDPKTDTEYVVHSGAYGLNQDNYNYVTSLGELRTTLEDAIVIDPAKPATCTESGLTEGKHNAVTGEVIVAQQVIPALGHNVVTDKGVPATCTEAGKTEGSHCSRCGEVLVAQTVIPAKGHTTVNDPKVEPTCTQPGKTAGAHCSECGQIFKAQTEIPAKGHTPVNVAAYAATCTKPGHTAGVRCSVCNEVISGVEEIPAKGHTTVNDPAVSATCTEAGHTAGTHCSVCNEILSGNETIPATGHTTVNVPKVDATCTEDGHTAGAYCSVCNHVFKQSTVIPAKGHTVIQDAAAEPTCTEAGHTAGTHCAVCKEILSGNVEIPALGHDIVIKPGRPATYTETGLTEGKFCNRCKKWIEIQQVIPKLVPPYLVGDVNLDGSVDVLDAIMIQKYAVDKAKLSDIQLEVGDVNNDGNVDVLDATDIQKYSVEKIKEFKKKWQ